MWTGNCHPLRLAMIRKTQKYKLVNQQHLRSKTTIWTKSRLQEDPKCEKITVISNKNWAHSCILQSSVCSISTHMLKSQFWDYPRSRFLSFCFRVGFIDRRDFEVLNRRTEELKKDRIRPHFEYYNRFGVNKHWFCRHACVYFFLFAFWGQ